MGSQNTEMDVESLQKTDRRRGSCLDAFFVMSIVFLFVAVTAVAAGGMIAVMDLQSKLKSSPQNFMSVTGVSSLTGPDPMYKMHKFAYLEAKSNELKNSTMQWTQVQYGEGVSLGKNYVFDPEQHSLKPEQAGAYFMYVDLNLTCTYRCEAGLLSVHVGNKLTCEVQLPAVSDSTPVTRKCWTVSKLDGEKLFTQMTVPEDGLQYWKLELNGSGLGMFLVD
ncbi:uncharacterized protein LOC121180994 [Toxotes jaculatrix]|uniref:uncharacterized protein LOC121180994 n=1 Tax=Toxotes jaculatrix TaxID=941984 RepID=UPI001B3AEA78|nr:uncharacterized protein LOC121180994 [Toxotes jaculatrix]